MRNRPNSSTTGSKKISSSSSSDMIRRERDIISIIPMIRVCMSSGCCYELMMNILPGSGSNGGGVDGRRIEGFVSERINAKRKELLGKMSVPVVLYLVICSSWNPASYQRPP